MGTIQIIKEGKEIFFRVSGDKTKFYDLENLVYNHPELKNDVIKNKIELERILMQQRELKQAYEIM